MNDNNRSGTFNDNKEGNSWWKILLAVVVVLVILGAVIAFAMNNKRKDDGVTESYSTTSTTENTTTTTNNNTNDDEADNDNVEEIDTRGTLGAHTVEIKSYRLVKDENGKDSIILTYEVENSDSVTMNFLTFLSDTAYQGTTKLETAVLKDIENFNASSITEDILPNGKREITRAFILSDMTTPVKAAVKQLVSTDNRVVTRTFEIKD